MSQQAHQIPNLNSLRSPRGGLRGLASKRAGHNSSNVAQQEDPQIRRDKIIQQTDNDASVSRMSAINLHYLDDEFAIKFVKPQDLPVAKRYQIINRGTYMRTTAIDGLFDKFLDIDPTAKKQVVSLGAGSDTRFFRKARKNVVFHELDFPTNTIGKITAIQQSTLLKNTITSTLDDPSSLTINDERTALYSPTLNIHPIDLRDLATTSLTVHNLDPTLPTLFLSECCLCYIPPETATAILKTLTSLVASSYSIIIYEPVNPFDAFGRTMATNLSSRGIELRTVKKYYSLAAQRERLKQVGFATSQGARTMNDIYYGKGREAWTQDDERARIESLEWLDEVEEWKLLGSHYCLAWAWKDGENENVFSTAWGGVEGGWTENERRDDDHLMKQ